MSERSDTEIGRRMAVAIRAFLTALAEGKFRPPTGEAWIIEADLLMAPELQELSSAMDEWIK